MAEQMSGMFRAAVRLMFSAAVCAAFVSCGDRGIRRNMEVLNIEDRGTYDCLTVRLEVSDGDDAIAYLLVPEHSHGEKLPAVLMLHDHGARFDIGKEKLVRPPAEAPLWIRNSSEQWVKKYFDGAYMADTLASSGYVVLAADALYWGSRCSSDARLWSEMTFGQYGKASGKDTVGESGGKVAEPVPALLKARIFEGQRHLYDSLARDGRIWAEKILDDDKACASFLASLPFVDRNKVGAFGFSMGAHRCWLLAAFSDDIRYGAAVCWMLKKDDYDSSSVSDLSMRIPSLRDSLDFPDIAGFICPKPMLFVSGISDPIFPASSAADAFAEMSEIYSSREADTFSAFFSGQGHHCGRTVQDSVYAFFASRDKCPFRN